jgi:hypothetical protein
LTKEYERFAKKNEMKVFQVSSQNKEAVNDLFKQLVLLIISNMDEENLKNRADSIKLESNKQPTGNNGSNGYGYNLGSYFSRSSNSYYKCC